MATKYSTDVRRLFLWGMSMGLGWVSTAVSVGEGLVTTISFQNCCFTVREIRDLMQLFSIAIVYIKIIRLNISPAL